MFVRGPLVYVVLLEYELPPAYKATTRNPSPIIPIVTEPAPINPTSVAEVARVATFSRHIATI